MPLDTDKQVMSTVKKYSDVDWLVGREFWEFISDDPGCMDEIYDIAGKVGEIFQDARGQTLSQILENKIAELQREFELKYGVCENEMWKNLLDKNS
jgi:hypothetical protein